jgi:hypothetical protein
MQLKIKIIDIWGEPVGYISQFGNLEVVDPLNDGRSAKVTLSMFDKPAAKIKPLEHLISVTYGDFLVFIGYIGRPVFDYKAGTIQVAAHDPTAKLKNHHHRWGDIVVDVGYPLDGKGYRQLLESSIPIEPQADRGIPGNGILWGTNDATPQGPRPTTDPPASGDGLWRRCERGANVWESLINAAQILGAPDFRFRPVDNEHPGVYGEVPPGFFCEFDTSDRIGDDTAYRIVYDHNMGRRNAANIVHEPDGFSVRNYWVQVYPGGERGPNDKQRRALYHSEASWQKYGIMQGWESSGQPDKQEVLAAKAQAWVQAYKWPPDFFTVTPEIDGPQVPVYMRDFETGDSVTVRSKKGYCNFEATGRVIQTTLRQVDASSNTKIELSCVPVVGGDIGEGDN